MWITQALRDVDLMTNQGQSILVFVGITSLIIPLLVMIDRAGRADDRGRLRAQQARQRFRNHRDERAPACRRGAVPPVPRGRRSSSSLLVMAISVYLSPRGLRELRRWATEVRADLVSNIVQPGRFTRIEDGLTLHIRERRAERPAARHLHRRPARSEGPRDDPRRAGRDRQERAAASSCFWNAAASSGTRPASAIRRIVLFDRYAFDLSQLRRRPEDRQVFDRASAISGSWPIRRRTIRCSPTSRASSAPNCTTASPRRSIPLAFVFVTLRLSGRAAHHPAEPHHCRCLARSARSRRCAASALPA